MRAPHTSPPIQVAFVEDDVFFARALADVIDSAPDMQLQGSANSCRLAHHMLNMPAAHVLLVDRGLPDGPAINITRTAQRLWPHCHVMVSTVFGDETHVIESLKTGVSGYLLKDSTPARVIEGIRNAHAGGSPISPLIARQLLTRFRQALVNNAIGVAPVPVAIYEARHRSSWRGSARWPMLMVSRASITTTSTNSGTMTRNP